MSVKALIFPTLLLMFAFVGQQDSSDFINCCVPQSTEDEMMQLMIPDRRDTHKPLHRSSSYLNSYTWVILCFTNPAAQHQVHGQLAATCDRNMCSINRIFTMLNCLIVANVTLFSVTLTSRGQRSYCSSLLYYYYTQFAVYTNGFYTF